MPEHPRPRPSWREYLRYGFDTVMSRGVFGLLWLAVAGAVMLLLIIAPLLVALKFTVTGEGALSDVPQFFWESFSQLFRLGLGRGAWSQQVITTLLGILALFFAGTILGSIAYELRTKAKGLAEGGGQIVARNHTVIIGWSPLGRTLVTELAAANSNRRKPYLAVLGQERQTKIQADLEGTDTGRTTVVVRSGKPTSASSFDLVRMWDAAKVVVVGDWGMPGYDDRVIATLLALARYRERHPEFDASVVACVVEPSHVIPARVAAKYPTTILDVRQFLSRLMLQMCLQPGLYSVYEELFDFEGNEMYLVTESRLIGRTFSEAVLAYPTSTPIGLKTAAGSFLHPPLSTVIREGDQLVVLTADDDTAILGPPATIDEAAITTGSPTPVADPNGGVPTQWLLIGWSASLGDLIAELDAYSEGPADVVLLVRMNDQRVAAKLALQPFEHLQLKVQVWRNETPIDHMIADVRPASRNYIVILNQGGPKSDLQDEFSLRILLHLRHALAHLPRGDQPVVVTELLNQEYRKISESQDAKDMVVTSDMVARLLAQLTETPDLLPILTDLCHSDGSEVYLKRAGNYVTQGAAVTYATLAESAQRRGEIAIGYRLGAESADSHTNLGVHLNPAKAATVTLGPGDRVIVISEDSSDGGIR